MDMKGGVNIAALVEDGVLTDLIVESAYSRSLVGNIYSGQVQNILPNKFTFIDIGKTKNAFLDMGAGDMGLRNGSRVLVQVMKDSSGSKGTLVSTKLSIAGYMAVLMENDEGDVGVSGKIPQGAERKRLKKIGKKYLPKGFNLIMRTGSVNKPEEIMSKQVAVLVGSLRREAFSRKMANALVALAPESLELQIVEIEDLPMYNQDFDDFGEIPPQYIEFRKKMQAFPAVILITPEYNRSVPAVLKNALDIGSRPQSESIWNGKPAAIISLSPGGVGAFGANHHLRQICASLGLAVPPKPDPYIGQAGTLFNEEGELIVESTRAYLQRLLNSFAQWVDKLT